VLKIRHYAKPQIVGHHIILTKLKPMKKLFLLIFIFYSGLTNAQRLLGTPKSLILVYNYPNNHFYIEINGVEKSKTDRENVFIIDNRPIQILALNKSKFLKDTVLEFSSIDLMKIYINWEIDYIENNLFKNTNNKYEFLKTKKGRDIAFWTYDMPTGEPEIVTDSTRKTPTLKQMFVITRTKDFIVGLNSPLFGNEKYDEIKEYLITNIDGLVESDNEIDIYELDKQVNK
jgi:hypothetical protein